jgi:hypothetical protein
MKTRPIGERFKYVDVTLEVRKGNSCAGCYYKMHFICGRSSAAGECTKRARSDGRAVVFVRVEP